MTVFLIVVAALGMVASAVAWSATYEIVFGKRPHESINLGENRGYLYDVGDVINFSGRERDKKLKLKGLKGSYRITAKAGAIEPGRVTVRKCLIQRR